MARNTARDFNGNYAQTRDAKEATLMAAWCCCRMQKLRTALGKRANGASHGDVGRRRARRWRPRGRRARRAQR
eukprot:3578789-Lingulodinium_polyedra.AAC.1